MSAGDLGVCGQFITNGRCPGRIIIDGQDGVLVEGTCNRCGSHQAVPAIKVNPAVLVQRRLDQANLPRRYFGTPFTEDASNKAALQLVRDWLRDYRTTPIPVPAFWGQAGRGKSHLLTAVCVKLIKERSQSVLYRSTRGLLRDMQDFDGDADGLWRRATTVDVLALDDFGAERTTEWRHDQLADLVDIRYEEERPILLATNYPPAAWPEMMDKRTASRLAGMVAPIELAGADRRQAHHLHEVTA